MKILLVNYRYFISGGPERYLFNVKTALEDQGHTVVPFSIKNCNNENSKYEEYFVDNIGKSNEVFVDKYPKTMKTYIDLIGREFYSFKVARSLNKLIRKEKPDVCYLLVYKRALSPSVINICKKYNIPVINRISDYNTVCGAGSLYAKGQYCEKCLNNDIYCVKNKCIKSNIVFSFMRFASINLHKMLGIQKKISAYICTNQFMVNKMIEYGYSREKLHLVPTFFKEDMETKNRNKENIIDAQCINFLFIGNIDESKGIYDLLEAIGLLIKKTSNFHLYVVGGLHTEENKRVKEIITKMKITKYITFVPFMTGKDVFNYYLKCNLTVLPTRWVENLPNTLIESIYFHRPVVVPDFGSFQFTTNEDVSFKYVALSSDSLYECLLSICHNPEQIRIKSKGCEYFFENNFSEKVHMEKLFGIIGRVLNESV